MRAITLVVWLVATASFAQRGVPQNGFPSWQERTVQVLVNRTRADPTTDPKACSASTVRPPVLWNYNLNRSARFHSTHMQKSAQFMHNSPCVLSSNIATTFPATCDGAVACACSTGAVTCTAAQNAMTGGCAAGTFSAWNSRISMFGTSPSAENIAYGYGTPRNTHNGWMNSSGHCTNILGGSTQLGVGYFATSSYYTENFGNGGTLTGSLIAGSHEPQQSGAAVEFRANYYNTAGGPQEALVNVDGVCSTMTLERGTQTNGTWLNTQTLTGTTCRRYVFTFKDPSGTVVNLPETGSYGVGGAGCADYATTAPAACSVSGNLPPTIATAPAASPSPVTANTTSLTVLGADDAGEAALVYTWSATGPATVTFSVNGTNGAKASTATFTRAGAYMISVSVRDAAGATASASVSVTVNATPTSLAVSPATASVPVSGTQQFTATVRDQFSQAIASATPTWTVSSGGTITTAGLFSATTAGGPFTVTASVGSVSGTAQVTVTNAAPSIATAAAASPSPVTASTTTLTVLGADDGGEAALRYTWAATGPASVTYSANASNAAKSSVATFTRAGAYVFTVTVRDGSGLTTTSTVNVTVQQTATALTVSPPSVTLGPSGTQQFTAALVDQFSQPMAATPTWMVSGGGTVNSNGLFTAGTTPGGPHSITATAASLVANAQVSVGSGAAPTIAMVAAAAPSTVTGTTTALTVLGADDGGEGALAYTWSSTGPAPVTFSPNGTNAAKASTATFARAGTYQFLVTITDAQGLTVTSTISVTVNATPSSLAVTPATSTVVPASMQAFTASVADQFGDALATQPTVTWMVSGGGTITSTGVFTAGSSAGGPFTVTATAAGQSGTAQVTVSQGAAPTLATAASATPNPVTGTTTALSVLGADDQGEAALTYTWSTPGPVAFSVNGTNAAKNATATFTRAGAFPITVTVRDAGGLTVTSQVTVVVQATLTALTVSPASTSVMPSASVTFTASGVDQFGNAMAVTSNWSVSGGGAISNGVFTAGATAGGPHTVTATAGSQSATAQVTISTTPPPPLMVQLVSPAAGTVSGLVTVSATTSDDARVANVAFLLDGAVLATDPSAPWSMSWDTALASPGSHVLTARATDGQGQVTSSADVTVLVVRTSGDVTPPVVTLDGPMGTVTGAALLRATANDEVGVIELVFTLDGTEVARLTSPPWSHDVPGSELTPGAHLVTVTARDAAGNTASDEGGFEVPEVGFDPEAPVTGSCGCTSGVELAAALALLLVRRRGHELR
jgi:hypothetical protein